jgi:hypothetical protein
VEAVLEEYKAALLRLYYRYRYVLLWMWVCDDVHQSSYPQNANANTHTHRPAEETRELVLLDKYPWHEKDEGEGQ